MERFTHLYEVELLQPIMVDVNKEFDIKELFMVIPTDYLRLLLVEFQKIKDKDLFMKMSHFIENLLSERLNFKDTIREVETMSPEFIEYVTKMIQQMLNYEKMNFK
ncbi:hypothetical protein [Cohnella soli]|uniref:Uncharacterized protein n=1 Tax=Cohnella soli TaxID=425005 RepID=A0ABW0HN56_9BACL